MGIARGHPVAMKVVGLATLVSAVALSGCGGSSNADRSYDCRLATPAQVAAATGLAVTSTEVVTSDSGPAGIRGCIYHLTNEPRAFVEVWSLRPGRSLYSGQAPAAAKISPVTPLHLSGVTGVVSRQVIPDGTRTATSSYALIGDTYVNWLVIGAIKNGGQAVTTLTRTAVAQIR